MSFARSNFFAAIRFFTCASRTANSRVSLATIAAESSRVRAKYAKCVGTSARNTSRYARNDAGGFDDSRQRADQYENSARSYGSRRLRGTDASTLFANVARPMPRLPTANASDASTNARSFAATFLIRL